MADKNTMADKKPQPSPYRLREGMIYAPSIKHGAGSHAAHELLEGGLINARGEAILRICTDLTVVTAKQIEDALSIPGLDPLIYKHPENGRNPYKPDIALLESKGLILSGRFKFGSEDRIKTYYPSKAAALWIQERMRYENSLFESKGISYKKPPVLMPALMRRLSANKFHIRSVKGAGDYLTHVSVSGDLSDAEYTDYLGRRIFLISVRSLKTCLDRANRLIAAIAGSSKPCMILLLTPDMPSARRLSTNISAAGIPSSVQILFTDDFEVDSSGAFPCAYIFSDEGYTRYDLFPEASSGKNV